jgi:DNA polymerase-1
MRPTTPLENKKRVLIIDALNMFLRSYTIIPSMNAQGLPNGGTVGFMKSLQKLCREMRPHEVVVCWDGHGGSEKKRLLNKNYKQGRRPVRFNRRMIELSDDEVYKNRADQQLRLHEYLNEMPVIQTMLDYVEADDVIAYVCEHKKYEGWSKIVVSSDKDFYQLCGNEDVMIWRPIMKVFINRLVLTSKFAIHPNNFALARAIDGDSSDNLQGVPRIGMKTISKYFPFLEESKQISCDELMTHCFMTTDKKSVHKKLLEFKERVKNNYKIMQLYEPNISHQGREKINFALNSFNPLLSKLNITKMLIQDGQGSLNLSDLWVAFRKNIL